ncbi:MAG: phosphonatase-like hydrolase [Acidobacteriota bacterium]|nr:phosphonatase-like hydrolase [Acidobacteriota bacterium]
MTLPALVVFDLAGTTIEDRGQVPAAFAAALAAHGIVATADQITRVRGASKRQAIRAFVAADAEALRVYTSFQLELAARFETDRVNPIAGAAECFRALRDAGAKVALTTGFDRDITGLLIAALSWQDAADTIVCGDDVAQGRPAPDLILRAMAETGVSDATAVATVGDTTLDLEAGAAAGVGWNIGVLSGAHGRPALERAPHTHLIQSVAALRGLWRLA